MHKSLWGVFANIIVAACCGAGAFAQQDSPEPIYRFDPVLSVAEPRPSLESADSLQIVVIEKGDTETNLRLLTETPVSPYLGAERAAELSPEERRLLPEGQGHDGMSDYKLEAGVGVHVENRASLNLGYRFNNPPSLLDERRNDPLSMRGDLRISFDLKIPFD